MGRVTLAFLWHMHQPFYVDLAEGRATLPWVRLHALKDYYDLPAIARRFPDVHQTFNLVPCLLDQLEAYTEGRLTDPFLEVASRGAHELTREDRLFLLSEFFSYHPPTMGARLPRLEQLRRMRGARPPHPGDDAAFAAWRESDYRDLQVLFHLAWCGPELSSRSLVARLIAKGSAFTQEELDGLLEMQRGFLREVEEQYRLGAREGTLELSVSPYYHPILPLLCDTGSARESGPHLALPSVPFHHPDDAALQVREARLSFAKRFGAAPSGMWPSEGALSNAALAILAREGIRWAATDEDILFASLGATPRDFGERSWLLHRPYAVPGGTAMFFRDHFLSDRIGFVYSGWEAGAAADDFVRRLEAIGDAAGGEDRVVPVILDGENAWEYYPDNGAPFLSALFARLSRSDRIRARTFSEILDGLGRDGTPPAPLPGVRAGSWIRADLTTWIGDEVKNRAWELLAETRAALGPPAPGTPAGDSLLAAEGSDWFWWFGDEHSSAHDADFDRTFRTHLQNAFALAGRDVPVSLGKPLAEAERALVAPPAPTGPLSIRLDGRASDYFEWLPAGRVHGDLGHGTMSRAGRLLSALLYGIDGERLALRLDASARSAAEVLEGVVLVVEFASPSQAKVRIPLVRGAWESPAASGCLGTALELLVPLRHAGAARGSRLAFRVLLEEAGGRRLEVLPTDGFVAFDIGAEGQDWMV